MTGLRLNKVIFGLFVLGCLSKSSAIILPVLLIGFDYYQNRRLSIKSVIEKIPFVIVSTLICIIAIKAAHHFGSIEEVSKSYNLYQQGFVVFYQIGFSIYHIGYFIEHLAGGANINSLNIIYNFKCLPTIGHWSCQQQAPSSSNTLQVPA